MMTTEEAIFCGHVEIDGEEVLSGPESSTLGKAVTAPVDHFDHDLDVQHSVAGSVGSSNFCSMYKDRVGEIGCLRSVVSGGSAGDCNSFRFLGRASWSSE